MNWSSHVADMLNVFKTFPEAAQQYRLCRQSPQLNWAVQELALYGRTLSLVSFSYISYTCFIQSIWAWSSF